MLKTNYIRYDRKSNTYNFMYLHPDILGDLSKEELVQYILQQQMWSDSENESGLTELCEDAKIKVMSKDAANTMFKEPSWNEKCEQIFAEYRDMHHMEYLARSLFDVAKSYIFWCKKEIKRAND